MSETLLALLIGGSALGLAAVLALLGNLRRGRRGRRRAAPPISVPVPQEELPPRGCPPLLFPASSSQLSSDAREALGAWGAELAKRPEFRIAVVGSADTAGHPARNRTLARERAQAAAAVLRSAGIPAGRLDVSWREPEPGRTEGDRAALRCVRINAVAE